MSLRIVPVTLVEANAFVKRLHRHHQPATGHRWSIGVADNGHLCGVAICERAKARLENPLMCEVTRVCTDGTKNACSMLYASCARAATAMGYDMIKTFILKSEPGTSLRAAGWLEDGEVEAQNWSRPSRQREITQHSTEPKIRYMKFLRDPRTAEGRKGCLGYGEFVGKCENAAGCPHSPFWCVRCNKIRMDTITRKLEGR